ncbi:hypothetical protein CDV55_100139 [Aspergillus turcosus]|nr:hypothetical protein CDV55_100139 [Aspergillus turcosus]
MRSLGVAFLAVLATVVANVAAAPMPTNNTVSVAIKGINISKSLDGHLHKRQSITINADVDAETGAELEASGAAEDIISNIIQLVVQAMEAYSSEAAAQRSEFTQQTVQNMLSRNPNDEVYAAAVCYDESWGVANYNGLSDVVTLTVSTALGDSTYDCMYMEYGNSFYIYGDGGYENLAYDYYTAYCSMNSADTLACIPFSNEAEVGATR